MSLSSRSCRLFFFIAVTCAFRYAVLQTFFVAGRYARVHVSLQAGRHILGPRSPGSQEDVPFRSGNSEQLAVQSNSEQLAVQKKAACVGKPAVDLRVCVAVDAFEEEGPVLLRAHLDHWVQTLGVPKHALHYVILSLIHI